MRIAVDAMGGDQAPLAIVQGALQAVKQFKDIQLLLVGREDEIVKTFSGERPPSSVEIIHKEEVIATAEDPVRSVRRKKQSSLVHVTRMVKEGEADACISAGNTGAFMTSGLLVTGRIKGIERPALTTIMPTVKGRPALVLDVGANVDAKPHHLLQYAVMGSLYATKLLSVDRPAVGLLNVGTEETKGNELMKETYGLLKETDLHFIGNVEGRDVVHGVADVIVCDGFSGNVLLKSTEGTAEAVFKMVKEALTRNTSSKLAAWVLKPGRVSEERRRYLEQVDSFRAVLEAVATEATDGRYRSAKGDREAKGHTRAEFLFSITPKTYDIFFNGASGYRAQFYCGPTAGIQQNKALLERLRAPLLTAARAQISRGKLTLEQIERSLQLKSAKAWINEDASTLDKTSLDADWLIAIDIPQWAKAAREAEVSIRDRLRPRPSGKENALLGVQAPEGTELTVMGAWLHDVTGEEWVPRSKRNRARRICVYGFA
jgi:phosphate acyltransferase